MQVYRTVGEASPCGRSAVALGFFDGLHIGHAAVISHAVRRAAGGLCPSVFTFTMYNDRPDQKQAGSELITDAQKRAILERWGVATVLTPDFSEFKEMSPADFADEILVRRLNAGVVCCGEDFRFGFHASAGVAELGELCAARGIELDLVPAVNFEGERVSSSRIRVLLSEGEIPAANARLGRAFGYDFTVVTGKRLGRTIDSPTINQRMPSAFVKLRYGVYASATLAEGKLYPSVTNIGTRPTLDDGDAVNSETYLYGFSGDLYGKNPEVRLLSFLRPEEKFPTLETLKAQIQADITAAIPIAEGYLAGDAEDAEDAGDAEKRSTAF